MHQYSIFTHCSIASLFFTRKSLVFQVNEQHISTSTTIIEKQRK